MISPHFPPDSNAGTHRVRLLAPHLEAYGWEPTVLTVDSALYEGQLDHNLERLVPPTLRVERAQAISAALSRRLGIGDLGLRSLFGLYRRAAELLSDPGYDALFITIYPSYTALLGPLLKKRFTIPFILDYQDPWVGAWGTTVGGGSGGSVDLKSRISRWVAVTLEPYVLRSADAITAVSAGTIRDIVDRTPSARSIPAFEIPIGGESRDFESLAVDGTHNQFFDPGDGLFHLCYVGTLLPHGVDAARALLAAVAHIRDWNLKSYRRLRVCFIGTSNLRTSDGAPRVMPHAEEIGVDDVVKEYPRRIDYLDALRVQVQASGLLLLGSSEHHYTASKLYPALLSGKPICAFYHKSSSVSEILGRKESDRVRLVTFGDEDPPREHVEELANAIVSVMRASPDPVGQESLLEASFSARSLAGVLASALNQLTVRPGPPA